MTIGISGDKSRIAQEFMKLKPAHEAATLTRQVDHLPTDLDRYLVCEGFLSGRRIDQQPDAQRTEAWRVNFSTIAAAVERIIGENDRARICILGSDSGIEGSFDMAYAGAKAALHLYIENRRLPHPEQQLVGIAPAIISDAGMTTRRADKQRLEERERRHPKQRFVSAAEVARLAHFLLYEDRGFISGTVIRVHGGEPACR